MLYIDISTDIKKKDVYELFNSFAKIGDIYAYYGVSDNGNNCKYLKSVMKEIGFDSDIYKSRNQNKRYCKQCGKELKREQKLFCSNSCSASYNNVLRNPMSDETKNKIRNKLKREKCKNDTNIRLCAVCGKVLSGGRTKFCSKECLAIGKKYKKKKNVEIVCQWCGKSFIGRSDRKYCSPVCLGEHNKNKRIQLFLSGKYRQNPNNKLPKSIRDYLYKKSNYKCELCGYEGYNIKTGKTILQIHHKDGDASNSAPDNVQVICPNCHAKTENYMALNKGKSARINRYKK